MRRDRTPKALKAALVLGAIALGRIFFFILALIPFVSFAPGFHFSLLLRCENLPNLLPGAAIFVFHVARDRVPNRFHPLLAFHQDLFGLGSLLRGEMKFAI